MIYDDCSDRILLFHKDLDNPPKEGTYPVVENVVEVASISEANLITSKCKDGKHAPVLDFDYPIEVVPSSQLGHYHLYLHKKLSWINYKQTLNALGNVGLIEPGFAKASTSKGYSSVRPVGVTKLTAPTGVDILVENAKLRQENHALRQELISSLKLIEEELQLTGL